MSTKMKFSIAVLLICICAAECGALTGKWRGELNMGYAKLPLVFNFSENAEGETAATMDSPQQNAKGIPLEVTFCDTDSISLTCNLIGASFNGKINGTTINGTFKQRGFSFPLSLAPEQDLSERRPQTPQPPFPYTERDTVFISSDGTELAGTLTMPPEAAGKKCPIIVMVTGSGPQNRDEEIFEHRPFAVIADYLARNGVASFRYDDRGTASSKGNYSVATIETFKADAESALRFAKSLPGVGKAGILGHSEGGTLAILIAAERKPDFIISLAGMATPSKETLLAQNIRSLDQLGIIGSQREASIRLIETLFDKISEQHRRGQSTPIDVELICKEKSLDVPAVVVESVKRNNQTRNPYFDSLVSLDPTESLKKIKCPVLAINGTRDVQVNVDANLKAFKTNVANVEIRRMEGLNHLMQHATTGEISEYSEISETISPDVLEIILDFIRLQ